MKICGRCNEEKPLNDFGPRPKNTDGRKGRCHKCETKRMMERYWKDPEKIRIRQRELATNPTTRFSRFKKRCTNQNKEMSLTFEQWSLLVSNQCVYCSGNLETKGCGLDRVDNNIGYLLGNCVPCCQECNRIKGNKLTYEEMLAVAEVLKNMRSNNV